MRRIFPWILAALVAQPLAAASLQDQFNLAQSAYDAGKMAEARSGFTAILPRLDANPKSKLQAAIVRSRLGAATIAMAEPEAGVALIEAALPALTPGTPEWMTAASDLGTGRELAIDFAGAAVAYRKVLAADPDPDTKFVATVGLARVLMFSDPVAARRYADEALALTLTPSPKKLDDARGALLSLRGRIELNDGQFKTAKTWFDKALASAGGLGMQVSVADIRIRGDQALAAYLTGDLDSARKYFAYTGAGGLPSQGFELGADMPLPACQPVGPLARDDMAVIEFSIDREGRVVSVQPIYATRPAAALEFASAVHNWSWQPDAAKKLPVFWRQAVRLELRCANVAPSEARPFASDPVSSAWLAEQGALLKSTSSDAVALPLLRAELARRAAAYGPGSPKLLPPLMGLIDSELSGAEETLRWVTEARAIATASGAPPDLVTRLRKLQVLNGIAVKSPTRSKYIQALQRLLAELDTEGAGQSLGAVLVVNTLASYASGADERVMVAAYRRVLATPSTVLPDGASLRQTARLQLATVEASAKRLDAARELLAQTGLTPEQCSVVPVVPILSKSNTGSANFPMEALQWGFEGVVRIAYDIDVEGLPVAPRTVTASPPLIFSAAAEKTARGMRYKPIFRDGASVGCSDMQRSVRYKINRSSS